MPKFSSGYSNKTTPVDNDKVLIADSEASDAIKSVTLANLVANRIVAKLQSIATWINTSMIGDGQVTDRKLKKTVAFSAFRNATLNTTAGLFTVMNFDAENYDFSNNFASNTFTAPVAGFYTFNWRLAVTGSIGRMDSRLTLNGVEHRRGMNLETTGTTGQSTVGMVQIPLAAGDQVRLEIFTPTSVAYVNAFSQCYFEGSLVSLT